MTTKVKVENVSDNSGQHDVLVEQVNTPHVTLKPGESQEFYVHSSNSLRVTEVPQESAKAG